MDETIAKRVAWRGVASFVCPFLATGSSLPPDKNRPDRSSITTDVVRFPSVIHRLEAVVVSVTANAAMGAGILVPSKSFSLYHSNLSNVALDGQSRILTGIRCHRRVTGIGEFELGYFYPPFPLRR